MTLARKVVAPGSTNVGFTLVELLVAIVILTMLLGVTFGAVRAASRSVDTSSRRALATEETRVLTDFLRRRLAALVPIARDQQQATYAFSGNETGFGFVGSAPRQVGAAGLFVYTLRGVEDGESLALSLGYGVFDPGAAETFDAAVVVEASSGVRLLAQGLDAVSFRYYGERSGNGQDQWTEPAWFDAWRGEQDGLPRLVGISIAGGQTRLPELVFRIRAENQR